jgi:hypothetical protein
MESVMASWQVFHTYGQSRLTHRAVDTLILTCYGAASLCLCLAAALAAVSSVSEVVTLSLITPALIWQLFRNILEYSYATTNRLQRVQDTDLPIFHMLTKVHRVEEECLDEADEVFASAIRTDTIPYVACLSDTVPDCSHLMELDLEQQLGLEEGATKEPILVGRMKKVQFGDWLSIIASLSTLAALIAASLITARVHHFSASQVAAGRVAVVALVIFSLVCISIELVFTRGSPMFVIARHQPFYLACMEEFVLDFTLPRQFDKRSTNLITQQGTLWMLMVMTIVSLALHITLMVLYVTASQSTACLVINSLALFLVTFMGMLLIVQTTYKPTYVFLSEGRKHISPDLESLVVLSCSSFYVFLCLCIVCVMFDSLALGFINLANIAFPIASLILQVPLVIVGIAAACRSKYLLHTEDHGEPPISRARTKSTLSKGTSGSTATKDSRRAPKFKYYEPDV